MGVSPELFSRTGIAADRVCIVIPTFERPEKLRRCLSALADQTGGPYTTCVVDDGGDGSLAALCAEFAPWVRYCHQDNAGPGNARNTGVATAPADALICFIDDDCTADPDWICNIVAAQADVPMRMVGGQIRNGLQGNPFSSASQAICSYLTEFYERTGSEMRFFTTNNMCIRAADFRDVGGFSDAFPVASEDRDLSLRWAAAGGSFVYAPDAALDHAHDLTFVQFWRQQASYGRGARDLHRAMDTRSDDRKRFEQPGFYLGMLAYPLQRPGRARLLQSVLIGLSHVALAAGYFQAARAARRSDV